MFGESTKDHFPLGSIARGWWVTVTINGRVLLADLGFNMPCQNAMEYEIARSPWS